MATHQEFGPIYNVESAALKKFRRNGGDHKAYGEAVMQAVRAAQRIELNRATKSMPNASSASRTWLSDGLEICKAVANQQQASLAACASKQRRDRTPEQWKKMYAEAMAEKRI
jgi:LmbE family N-acetylglucosaminyl deacetylase